MRFAILGLLVVMSLAATLWFYSFIESAFNMLEMLLSPFFTADPTDRGALWLGGPFLVLFLLAGGLWFIGVPLVASAVAGCLGGWGLGRSGRSLPKSGVWICSALAAVCATALVVAVIQPDVFPTDRPTMKPKTPPAVLACLAGVNAALNALVGALAVRYTASRVRPVPPPLPG